ncbi:hypothetical protein C8J57DRAFT_1243441 [Mycena rebaudengoi]|nr:hypothetical protein C8J57DRAFT_1243441 [Mycena rebaudengoi]
MALRHSMLHANFPSQRAGQQILLGAHSKLCPEAKLQLTRNSGFPMDDSTPAKGQESNQRRADIDEEKNGPKSEIPLQSSTIEHTEYNQKSTLSAGWKVVMPVKAILMIYLALNSLYKEAGVSRFYAHSGRSSWDSPVLHFLPSPVKNLFYSVCRTIIRPQAS